MGLDIRKINSGQNKKGWELCEFNWHEQWSQILELFNIRSFNWHTFTLFKCEFDYDKYGPLFSFDFCLFGLGFYVSFNPPWQTKQSKMIKRRVKDAKKHPERLKPWKLN